MIKPVLPVIPASFQQKLQNGRDHAHAGHPFILDSVPKRGLVKTPVQHGSTLSVKWRDERDHDPVHMMDRQHAHEAMTSFQSVPSCNAVGIDEKIFDREHDSFWRSRRSGGVDNQCFILESSLIERPAIGCLGRARVTQYVHEG